MKEYIAKNHRWIIGTLVAIIVPLLIYSFQKHDATQPETKTFYYANFESKAGNDNLKKADCWEGSLSSTRSDAFRCFVDNSISDPCFENPFIQDVVLCPSEPYEKNPEFFKMLSRPKPDQEMENKTYTPWPWYIVLDNKQECRFITGGTAQIVDNRLDYECNEGIYKFLFLPLKENGKELQIECSNGNKIEFCSIQEAWY